MRSRDPFEQADDNNIIDIPSFFSNYSKLLVDEAASKQTSNKGIQRHTTMDENFAIADKLI
jgi:hypothetical protein